MIKYLTLILFGFLSNNIIQSQIDFSKKWISVLEANSGFQKVDLRTFDNLDFSKVISNQLRFENDPISTYIGIFGPNYHRIDFYLKATKNGNNYSLTGKSKLDQNIRELNGAMNLRMALSRRQNYITDSLYIAIFDCVLREPGNKDGDGVFTGVFSLVFYKKDNEVYLFKTDSGDEPTYTNTFVGKWNQNNSIIERKVIFSFQPAGLYEKLPFCEELYTIKDFNDDYLIIKPEYEKYGWADFNYKGKKTDWWK